ncbi:DENN domain-containing protein 2C [Amia ocellicauda]|uniref:DENN domain-containing protein 2C n=1 Tax=Amia ocellicauda TaxID=2972642 RepID=UPI003463FDB2
MHAPGGTAAVWHSPSSGRVLTRSPGVNIKQKISQWEGRSQLGVDAVHRTTACTYSHGLGNGNCKAGLAKAKSLGLDFREGWNYNSKQQQQLPTGVNRRPTNGVSENPDARKTEISPPPEDPGTSLPPGNFYTSRGFWKKMEESPWAIEAADVQCKPRSLGCVERGVQVFEEVQRPLSPPPKPQRTFQYLGEHSPPGHWDQPKGRNGPSRTSPPSGPPPPCPATLGNGISRGKKNRKSFEFEDAERLQFLVSGGGAGEGEGRRSGLYHTMSEDNIYEDIIYPAKENPYEDVKPTPCYLLKGSNTPWKTAPRQSASPPKLPPKPSTLLSRQMPTSKTWRGRELRKMGLGSPPSRPALPASRATEPRRSLPGPDSAPRYRQQPRYVTRIQEIFNAKRGKKRVKTQLASGQDVCSRDDASGTESDPEENSTGSARRSVYVHSTLKRNPRYQTLERDLFELQEQQLFELFVVVSLRKKSSGNTYTPEITQQFPNKFEKSTRQSRDAEDRLKAIPMFCFPDSQDWRPSAELTSETFSFVLTGEDGSRWFGYCRKILPSGKGKRLPEVHCIVSRLGCFSLFAKVLEEVERRREISPALVYPFMRSVMEAPFPAPGRTIAVKSFLPGSGNEVLSLCRPVDSRLEHVDFECLLQCLGLGRLVQVFASLVLERRVIFVADKLSTLSRCAHAAIALLYPFTWQHTYIPVLPASMIDISCSPTPFLIGVLAGTLPDLLELPIEEVLIVDLCEDRFIRQISDEDCILPSKLQAALQQILEERGDILEQEDSQQRADLLPGLSTLVSEAFVRFFVEVVGHYSLHMGGGDGGLRALRREAFRKSHPSRGARQFLQLFMETQMFAGFIQDRELRKGGVKGLFELRAAEYLESTPEPSGVNKFLKGLGNKMKFLQKK